MLRRIEVWNWISFEHERADNLDYYDTIAVVGDNGHGKSAFLEAVLFALYGEGRADTISRLVRENSDGLMKVEVEFVFPKQVIFVTRGVRKGGQSFAYVEVNDEKVAQGASVREWATKFFGVGADLFLLTVFFGLGAADGLMKVRPSARLETLQEIANVSVYTDKLHPAAKKEQAQLKRKRESAEDQATALEPYIDVTELRERQKEARDIQRRKQDELDVLSGKLSDLEAAVDRNRALYADKSSLQANRNNAQEKTDVLAEELKNTKQELKSSEYDVNLYVAKIKKYEESIEQSLAGKSLVELKERETKLSRAQFKYEYHISLKGTAAQEKVTECPLCGGAVEENIQDRWLKEKGDCEHSLEKVVEKLEQLRSRIDGIGKRQGGVREYKITLKSEIQRCNGEREHLIRVKNDCAKAKVELKKLDDRFVEVNRKLAESQVAQEEFSIIQKKVVKAQEAAGACGQKVKDLAERIVETLERKREYTELLSKARKYKKEEKAASIVVEAFSRYGIPVDLMRGLCKEIESKATAIYKQLDAGQVIVQDVEDRGKPGVEFILRHRTGMRRYNELSEGQKVMLFLSVRLAIAKIIMQARGLDLDFLILDEVTSHLSPAKRDELAVLINKILRNTFSQVFMVSHAPIRDIFSASINVEMVNDISTLVVK